MSNFIEKESYFFNNIFPYLSRKEKKVCLKEIKKNLIVVAVNKKTDENLSSKKHR